MRVQPASTINKDGQLIGRKGAESRARLLLAARELMNTTSVQKITVSAIARGAGLASQTFYLYFADVEELLLHLCAEVTEDTARLAALLDAPWRQEQLQAEAEHFIAAFYAFWDQHRPVLSVRNFMADNGHPLFDAERNRASLPIVAKIGEQILSAHAGGALARQDAMARAVIIFSAIERMAQRYSNFGDNDGLSSADLKRAEAHILSLLLTRVTTQRETKP